MAQIQIGSQDLERAVSAAARTALKAVNISVPPDHQIFSDLRDFANGRNQPNTTVEQDFNNAAKAKKFVSVFTSEIKKAGVYEQYAKTMDVTASGTNVVFTQKAAGEKASPAVGEAIASGPLGDAIKAAAKKTGVTIPAKIDVASFALVYKPYLKDKAEGNYNGGATLQLVLGPKKTAQDFAATFLGALDKPTAVIGITAKVVEDSPNKFAVVLEIPPLNGDMKFSDAEAFKPKKAR